MARYRIDGPPRARRRRGEVVISVFEVGELGLIDRIAARLGPVPPGVPVGPGDDAAVVPAPDGRVVATTDLMVEGWHWRREWSSAYDVGRKAAAANLADVAAMGARATALLVGLACPPDVALDWVDGLADGLRDECDGMAAVVGGDVVGSDRLTIAVTALGDLQGEAPMLRSGARVGDVVVAAGRLGWAAAGLRLLADGQRDGPLVGAHRRPEPPYDLALALAGAGATAMIDVSDGLLADLGHVAEASGVRIDLDLATLRRLGADGVSSDELLTGGDDHAFAATIPAGALAATVSEGALLASGWREVGRVSAGAGITVNGERYEGSRGHQHFEGGR